MKKLYAFIILAFAASFTPAKAQAPQCQYDYTWLALGKDGVFPDSATNFVSGTVGVPYTQHVTIKVPYDTTDQTLGTLHFAHIDLQTNITNPANYGLPPGLSLVGTPSNLKFPGNDTSCMVIYGTPTVAGTYQLSFTLKTFVSEFPFASVNTQTLTYYYITINPAVGISENNAFKFEVSNPLPNPAVKNTQIKYTVSKNCSGKFTLFNTLGKSIMSKKLEAKQGENSFDINVSELSSGIYIYSIELDGKPVSKRLIVNND